MANVDAAFGLKPIRERGGAAWSGKCTRYFIPATDGTAVYLGGLVKLAGSADADGVATVTGNVSAGDVVVGVVVGVEAVTQASTAYREASTARYVFVVDDPETVFIVQEDSDTSTLAATSVGLNADLIGFTSGSTTTNRSAIELDSNTADTTATLDVQILGLHRKPDNVIGANAIWEVKLNNHQFVDGTTGV